MVEESKEFPNWMRGFLILSGMYNLAWGLFIYNFPDAFYKWITKSTEAVPPLIVYQGIGVLTFAILYLIAALYPVRLWFLIALGVVSKLLGAIGFFIIIMNQQVTKTFLFHFFMNDLIWVLPLSFIAVRAFRLKAAKE